MAFFRPFERGQSFAKLTLLGQDPKLADFRQPVILKNLLQGSLVVGAAIPRGRATSRTIMQPATIKRNDGPIAGLWRGD